MSSPLVIVLPAGEPPDPRPPGFPSLATWPRHPDAVRWRSLPLDVALTAQWEVDAHWCQYTRDDVDTWPRLHVSALAEPDAAHYRLACAVADLDRPEHAPWPDALRAELAVAVLHEAYPGAAVYSTRAGVRLVWTLGSVVPLEHARWWLRAWHAARAAELPPELGLEYDLTCAEWTRHFRLPYVVRDGAPSQSSVELDGVVPVVWSPRGVPETETRRSGTPQATGDEPTEVPPPDPEWHAWVTPTSVIGRYVGTLTRGEPWGPPVVPIGTRNAELKRAVNSLAFQYRRGGLAPTSVELFAVFRPSVLAELARDPGADGTRKLWSFCAASASAELDRRRTGPPTPDPSDPAPPPPELVTHGDGVGYVLRPDQSTYVGPLRGSDLYMALREYCGSTIALSGRGGKLRGLTDILVNHAVPAADVELHYPGVGGAVWDPVTRRARVQTLPDVQIEPREDPAVGEWLDSLLGGNAPEVQGRALDWLATCGDLSRPTATLYLQGPPSAGKGLLAAGVAALWKSAPVAFSEAIGVFNEGVLTSPVVFLDEGVAADRATTARFRSMAAETHHRVQGKNKPFVSLHGCPRFLVAANNARALELTGEHDASDLAAIVDRILHVRVSPAAVDWLADYGGRAATDPGWVREVDGSPGRVPRHLAWLASTRQVVPGVRFLVGGVVTEYHVRLLTGDPLYGQILAAVASALAPTAHGAMVSGAGVLVESGEHVAWVNPVALHARWKTLVVEDVPKPTVQRVARGLQALSRDHSPRTMTEGNVQATHWPVAADLVLRAAEDLGFPGMTRLRAVFASGNRGPVFGGGTVTSIRAGGV